MLLPRTSPSSTRAATSSACSVLKPGELIISRTGFIIAITLCIFITGLSLLGISAFAYREYARRREKQAASTWGRKSLYRNRMSHIRHQINASYDSQYKGCLVTTFENPEMGSESPVEMTGVDERVWEVPAVPAVPAVPKRAKVDARDKKERRSRVSLFFDYGVGLWVSKK